MKTLSAKEVREKLNSDEDTVLINALGAESFRAKHIPGSINILPDKNQEIIVYCASPDCSASSDAAKKLNALGYTNVSDFEAGFTGWLKEGFRLVRADQTE